MGPINGKGFESWEELITALREIVGQESDAAVECLNIGSAYEKIGCFSEAAVAYKEAARLMPQNTEAHYCLGFAYNLLDRHEEAVASFQETILLQPDHAGAHYYLGLNHGYQGRFEEAVSEVDPVSLDS